MIQDDKSNSQFQNFQKKLRFFQIKHVKYFVKIKKIVKIQVKKSHLDLKK